MACWIRLQELLPETWMMRKFEHDPGEQLASDAVASTNDVVASMRTTTALALESCAAVLIVHTLLTFSFSHRAQRSGRWL